MGNGKYCGDCKYIDFKNCRTYNNTYRCTRKGWYVGVKEGACDKYAKRYDLSAESEAFDLVFFATETMGLQNGCYITKNFTEFKNTLEENPFLEVEKELCNMIRNDQDNLQICGIILRNYIIPICEIIKSDNKEYAINMYQEMIYDLSDRYFCLEDEFEKDNDCQVLKRRKNEFA